MDKFSAFIDQKGSRRVFGDIRAGFEEVLTNLGKPIVMLYPWPNGIDFGKAATSGLWELSRAAIRFLWASQRLGKSRGAIDLGRFGLSGFSAGGGALFPALQANLKRVHEVYAFDANGSDKFAPLAIQWATSVPNAHLRMTAGFDKHVASNLATMRSVQTILAA